MEMVGREVGDDGGSSKRALGTTPCISDGNLCESVGDESVEVVLFVGRETTVEVLAAFVVAQSVGVKSEADLLHAMTHFGGGALGSRSTNQEGKRPCNSLHPEDARKAWSCWPLP